MREPTAVARSHVIDRVSTAAATSRRQSAREPSRPPTAVVSRAGRSVPGSSRRDAMARTKAFNDPPDCAQSLPLFEQAMGYRETVGKLLKAILDARGLVQVPSIRELHNRLC